MSWHGRTAVTILVLAGACAGTRALDLRGDGAIHAFTGAAGRGTLNAAWSHDGQFMVSNTTGPAPRLVCVDSRLRFVRSTDASSSRTCRGAESGTVLTVLGTVMMIYRVPSLEIRDEQTFVDTDKFGIHGGVVEICFRTPGWIWVNRGGQVVEILPSPLRSGRHGKAKTHSILAAGVDPKTGLLVLAGEGGMIETFDLETMTSTRTVELEREDLGHDLCTAGGVAWLASKNGTIVELDVASLTVRRQIVLAETDAPVDARVDLSESGKLLAASCSVFVRGDAQPTTLKLYRVEDTVLHEVASARVDLPHVVQELTIAEDAGAVVLHSQHPVFVWKYSRDARQHTGSVPEQGSGNPPD